jgi:periplasmic protein TonB
MDFSQRQRDPRRHLAAVAFVVLLHAAIVYALLTGLAKKVVDVVRAPIETKVIEEIRKPPPETVVPPPPRLEAPPPPFIPPPEVQIAAPPPPAPTITAVTPTPPPLAVTITPAPPPPVTTPAPAPTPVAQPKPQGVAAICTKLVQPDAPAVPAEGTATVVVSYTIQAGKVTKMDVVRYSFPGTSDRKIQRSILLSIESAAREYQCNGDHVGVTQEFAFHFK